MKTSERAAVVQEALAAGDTERLSRRYLFILTRRAEGETLAEIGAEMGCSSERVRQLEGEALRILAEVER